MTYPKSLLDNHDLQLVVRKKNGDGTYTERFVTEEEYQSPNDLGEWEKLGVAIICGETYFIVALNDEPSDAMIWSMANELYGDDLPSGTEGRIISARWSYINSAIRTFGGTAMSGYLWTSLTYANYDSADTIYNGGGFLYSDYKSSTNKVRLVYTREYQ